MAHAAYLSATSRTHDAIVSRGSLGQRLEQAMLQLVRTYTFNTPLERGKYRLYLTALKYCTFRHDSLQARAKDGREFWINLTTGMHDNLFFVGEYERAITSVVRRLVRKGDVCIDVGANFGWYTTLCAQAVGSRGAVHAFEPVPETFRELKRNYALLPSPANVFLNNSALGDRHGSVTLNLFSDLPTGHASISSQGREGAVTFECPMLTLNSYLEDNHVDDVDFLKVDIEGAEMMFLNGAGRLFEQKAPPVILMEMALQQTGNFGYKPDDLVKFIAAKADYDFYIVDETNGRLDPITGFADGHIGGNVFCIPSDRSSESIADLIN